MQSARGVTVLTEKLICREALMIFRKYFNEYEGRIWSGEPDVVDHTITTMLPLSTSALLESIDEFSEKRLVSVIRCLAEGVLNKVDGSRAVIFAKSPEGVTQEKFDRIRLALWIHDSCLYLQVNFSVVPSSGASSTV